MWIELQKIQVLSIESPSSSMKLSSETLIAEIKLVVLQENESAQRGKSWVLLGHDKYLLSYKVYVKKFSFSEFFGFFETQTISDCTKVTQYAFKISERAENMLNWKFFLKYVTTENNSFVVLGSQIVDRPSSLNWKKTISVDGRNWMISLNQLD